MRRIPLHLALFTLVALGAAACSDDSSSDGAADTIVAVAPGASDGANGSAVEAARCEGVPSAADLSAAVGVTLSEGDASVPGVCNFYGVDDTSNLVALLPNNDPGAVASFQALGADSGVVPLNDGSLPGAVSQFGSVLYLQGETLYSVSVLLVGVDPTAATEKAVAVMKLWVGA